MIQTFRKAYTRNFSIIMQEAWSAGNKENIIGYFGLTEYPYDPPYIYFMKDGVEEVWENVGANEWIIKQIVAKMKAGPKFFPELYKRYADRLGELERWWIKGAANLSELEVFIDKTYAAVADFTIIYNALDSSIPAEYRQMAETMREKDVLFAECNTTIWKALGKIYPGFGYLSVYITREELGKEFKAKELEERDNGFVVIPGVINEAMSFDELRKKFPQYKFEMEKGERVGNVLKGRSAYGGNVTGRVRIVKRKDQIELVQEGEVIVSPMTTPDFLPAMKKAAAFVTDEGGITCHAAIIAREIKKPCVIGTKIATEVIKDGDMVEVDADKGIVRIIN